MKTIKRYVPEKVYDKIITLDYKLKEHLYIVCDMIYRVSIYKKEDEDYSNRFVDIPRYYFRDIFKDYKKHINYLIDNNILESDNVYSLEGGKAIGYRFNEELISKLKDVRIEKKTITKKIIKNRNERNNLVNENLHTYKNHFLNTFKIDYDKAIEYLNNWYDMELDFIYDLKDIYKLIKKYNHLYMSINSINDNDLFFRKNSTNGRVDTNLTSLKSEFKQFIIGEYYQIDIVNSQPFFLSLLLKNSNVDKKELDKYIDWTSNGKFYEMFEQQYLYTTGKYLSRKEIKTIMFCIFYSKNGSYRKEKIIFKKLFPNILEWIESKKNNNYKEFAISLQKIESEMCIDIICKELDKVGIKYYTIHDAWLVSENDKGVVEKIIYTMFSNKYNSKPKLKIEKI